VIKIFEESVLGGGTLVAIILGYFFVMLMVNILVYVFSSLAFMAIGKKANLNSPGLAWIPGLGPILIPFLASKMHRWPWLLLIGGLIPLIGIIPMIVFSVYTIIWHWKMFEAINKPGWWAILLFVPLVNIIIICMAAWGK